MRLAPKAVLRRHVGGAHEAFSWAELAAKGEHTPPFEPVFAVWSSRLGQNHWWAWSPRWEAAAGQAFAHLLAASEGRPITVPKGLVAAVFQRALDALLPVDLPAQRAVLAGPGGPVPTADADILFVPVHPQTGESWKLTSPPTSAYRVPLPFGVWQWLASQEPDLPTPASGRLPDGVLLDYPPPPLPDQLFRLDPDVFRNTLVRLPAVRSPWLRKILGNLTQPMYARFF